MGTSVPEMGTCDSTGQLGAALFGKSKRALLALFYVQPERSFYLRQVMRTLGIGQGAVQRELARLVDAGLLVRTQVGSQVHYQANAASPIFAELKSLMLKSSGVADVLREALASRRVPTREQTREISAAVFNYFRWFGWCDRLIAAALH